MLSNIPTSNPLPPFGGRGRGWGLSEKGQGMGAVGNLLDCEISPSPVWGEGVRG